MAPDETPLPDIAELERQWKSIKSGEATVPHADVARWLETWGTPDFQPWTSGQRR